MFCPTFSGQILCNPNRCTIFVIFLVSKLRTFLQFARMFYYMAEFRGLHYLFDIPFATWQPIFAYCARLSTRLIFPYQPFSNSRLTAITYGAVACFQDGIPMWLGTRHEAVKHDFFSLLHWGSKILKNSGFFFFLSSELVSFDFSEWGSGTEISDCYIRSVQVYEKDLWLPLQGV